MKFRIKRTSIMSWQNDKQPCEEAYSQIEDNWFDWYVNLEPKDLLSFVDKYGEIIIDKDDDGTYQLEIYDGYRE